MAISERVTEERALSRPRGGQHGNNKLTQAGEKCAGRGIRFYTAE